MLVPDTEQVTHEGGLFGPNAKTSQHLSENLSVD